MSLEPSLSGAAAARRAAAAILHEGRFHPPAVPHPLHGVLHDLGAALRWPADALSRLATWLGDRLPGGAVTGWFLVIVLLAGVAGLVGRRYSLAALASATPPVGGAPPDPPASELARAADRAERDGRFAEAVRLRFRAGLLGLAEQQVVPGSATVPTSEISRRLACEPFDALARQFDAIAYGGARAQRADADQAREGWRTVRAPAARR